MGDFSDAFSAASGGDSFGSMGNLSSGLLGGDSSGPLDQAKQDNQPMVQPVSAPERSFGEAFDLASGGSGKGGTSALDKMKIQQTLGVQKAAAVGGYEGTLDYLDKTDPSAAEDLRKKHQDYQNSVQDNILKQAQTDREHVQLSKDYNTFNGNVYNVIDEQMQKDPTKGAAIYQKFLPELRKTDPNAPDTYDPDRGMIAQAQAVDAQMKAKHQWEVDSADKAAERDLSKPYTELGKQQADLQNAIKRGDMISAHDLQTQIQDGQFKLASERIKASSDMSGSLRKEYLDQSKDYTIARGAWGQALTGLTSKTPQGDLAGVIGIMQLYNPKLQLAPGKALDAAEAGPGVAGTLINTYNTLVGNPDKGLDDVTRKAMLDQGVQQFHAKDTAQQQLDGNYTKLAQQQGLDPKSVVLDLSPKASPYTPDKEAQLRQMSDEKITALMAQAKAAGATDQEIQQKRAIIDNIRKGPVDAITKNGQVSNIEGSLYKLAPKANPAIVTALSGNADVLQSYGINTPARQRAFAAQMAHESGGFRALEENISNAQADKNYGGRLGNDNPGDGSRYKGRGIIQLTGKDNYRQYSKAAGVNLVANPELAADPNIAVKVAAAYWSDHGLNQLADQGDVRAITKRINGGYNGLDSRAKYQARADNLGLFGGTAGDQRAISPEGQGKSRVDDTPADNGSGFQPAFKGMGMPGPDQNGQPTSEMGMDRGRLHAGNDFYVDPGTPLQAQAPGRIVHTVANTGVGNYGTTVVVQYDNGKTVQYSHLKPGSIQMAVGDAVEPGQVLALTGASGTKAGQGESGPGVTPPHVHIEMTDNDNYKGGYIGGKGSPSRAHLLQPYKEFGLDKNKRISYTVAMRGK